jgi:hypothetical protein
VNAETIHALLHRQPFEPLEVRLSNGDAYKILHPEFAILLETTLVIGVPKSDRVILCSLPHIASIERIAPARAV